jgi:hypothetical protein
MQRVQRLSRVAGMLRYYSRAEVVSYNPYRGYNPYAPYKEQKVKEDSKSAYPMEHDRKEVMDSEEKNRLSYEAKK